MFEGKRSQAAMEFLMTYGWAMMVVLLALGALAYFGILNPTNLLPERCTFPVGLQCADHLVNARTEQVTFNIVNGKGEGIILYNVTLADSEGNFNGCVLDFNQSATACDNIDIMGSSITYCQDASGGNGWNDKTGLYIGPSEVALVTVNCTEITDYESKARADVFITWYQARGTPDLAHTEKGELYALAVH